MERLEGKTPLGRRRSAREDNIKFRLVEIRLKVAICIISLRMRTGGCIFLKTIMNHWGLCKSWNFINN